jgi:hypothetical protein
MEIVVQELLTPLYVVDVHGICKTRIGGPGADGSYVVLDHELDKIEVIFSVGVGENVAFEEHFLRDHPNVEYIYFMDHTVESLPCADPKYKWEKTGVSCTNEETDRLKTLSTEIRRHNALKKRKLLKADCEGCEFPAIYHMSDEELLSFDQIMGEFHWLNHVSANVTMQTEVFKRLAKHFYLYHVGFEFDYDNHFGTTGGYAVPQLIVPSYIRKDLIKDKSKVRLSASRLPDTLLGEPGYIKHKEKSLLTMWPFDTDHKKQFRASKGIVGLVDPYEEKVEAFRNLLEKFSLYMGFGEIPGTCLGEGTWDWFLALRFSLNENSPRYRTLIHPPRSPDPRETLISTRDLHEPAQLWVKVLSHSLKNFLRDYHIFRY